MPSLMIADELLARLARRAAAANLTVEQLIAALVELSADSGATGHAGPGVVPFDDWKKMFETWMADVRTRAHRYPPGFVLDDSRESIYEGCGE